MSEKMTETKTRSFNARVGIAKRRYDKGEEEQAIKIIDGLLSWEGLEYRHILIISDFFKNRNEHGRNIDTMKIAVERGINQKQSTISLATLYAEAGLHELSVTFWRQVQKFDSPNYIFSEIKEYDTIEFEEEARAAAIRILEMDPSNSLALFELGKYYFNNDNHEYAVSYGKMALSTNKTDSYLPFINNLIGASYHLLGKYKESITHSEEALRQTPENFVLCANIANTYISLGNFKEAYDILEKADYLKERDRPEICGGSKKTIGNQDSIIKYFEQAEDYVAEVWGNLVNAAIEYNFVDWLEGNGVDIELYRDTVIDIPVHTPA